MPIRPIRLALVAGLGLVAACTTPSQRGTEVTRFHLGEPIARQAVDIEPAVRDDADSLEWRAYADIVARELAELGFRFAEGEQAEMIALVDVVRDTRIEAARRAPVTIGVGGGSYGRSTGVGAGASFGVGGRRGGETMVTLLDVKLKRRSEGTIVWEGQAVRADRAGDGDLTTSVARLADALFEGFPGESGRTITVE